MSEIKFKSVVSEGDPLVLIDFLESKTKLSKSILKKVLNIGGVWLKKFPSSKLVRCRRATTEIFLKSYIEFYYDPKFLSITTEEPKELIGKKNWGLWFKPAGVLSQGNEYSDHASILRLVQKIKNLKDVYPVHRLDREASGVMIVAYHHKLANLFSKMFQAHRVKKIYKIEVLGNVQEKYPEGSGQINLNLDNKEAKSLFKILEQRKNTTLLEVEILTGRLHQIRRHFDLIGFPVMGDPKYGKGNKNKDGMKLLAYKIEFMDPESKELISFALNDISL